MKQLGLVSLVALFALMGCSSDGYVYPSVVTTLVEGYIDSDTIVSYIITDEGEQLTPTNTIAATGVTTDSIYRMVAVYSIDGEGSSTTVYSIKYALSAHPVSINLNDTTITSDPLYIQSLWRGGNYLNVIAQPMAQDKAHQWKFYETDFTTADGKSTLSLLLYHNQNEDVEAYKQKRYLSIPLTHYSLTTGDTIKFTANTYDKGLKTWSVCY